jgi:uncharacterized protein
MKSVLNMKKVFLSIITFYQKYIAPIVKQFFGIKSSCRFYPTCSEYAKASIEKHGVVSGGWKAMRRVLNCQPFSLKRVRLEARS